MSPRRGVTPIVAWFRDWLIGHKYQIPLRYEGAYAPRTQPPPTLPPGPAHKLSTNYYYNRDPRREVMPPELSYHPLTALASGKDDETKEVAPKAPPIPGMGYNWETGKDLYQSK